MKYCIYRYVTILSLLIGVGCGQNDREVRHYREVSFIRDDAAPAMDAPMSRAAPGGSAMPNLPPEMQAPPLPLEWQTPAGWENRGGSGMRIGTLVVEGQECTILSFPGDVGGDAANIRRWLGQLGHSVPEEQLQAFVARPRKLTTVGGHAGRLFDFAELLPSSATMSTLAAIIDIGDHTAFVKLTGAPALIAGQKEAFEALCQSIQLKDDARALY